MRHEEILAVCKQLSHQRIMRQRKVLSGCCLHIGQPAMLEYIRLHPGCTQKEMADEAHVTPASVAASFKRLENAGLIRRRVDTSDTRCNRVYITEAGERELRECFYALKKLDEDMLAGIDDQSLDILKRCLSKMLNNLSD